MKDPAKHGDPDTGQRDMEPGLGVDSLAPIQPELIDDLLALSKITMQPIVSLVLAMVSMMPGGALYLPEHHNISREAIETMKEKTIGWIDPGEIWRVMKAGGRHIGQLTEQALSLILATPLDITDHQPQALLSCLPPPPLSDTGG